MSVASITRGGWLARGLALALAGVLASCGGGGSDAPAAAAVPGAAPAPAPIASPTPTASPTPIASPAPAPSPVPTASPAPATPASPAATTGASPAPADNVVAIRMDRGLDGSAINSPFVTVTVCQPGTQDCRTIDHILLDTGSVGLRVTAQALRGLALPAVAAASGAPLAECASFASGYTWGSVRNADVRLGGQQANAIPVHVMDDPGSVYATVPADCSDTGAPLPDAGSNGILGVGFTVQDCGPACAASALPGVYFACTATGCTGVAVPTALQVAHPVAALPGVDNNGLAIVLPEVPAGGAQALDGSLLLGIGTRGNNQLGTAPVYTANAAGNFTTTYKGRTSSAFIDSGSNGIFFADSAIPRCSSGFYCPATALSLSATATGVNGASVAVPFTVENAAGMPFGTAAARLGGSVVLGRSFDWGLPFFFGRAVFVAISGRGTPAGPGPFWAF